ncbi:thiolase family protein [Peribacillus sp. RS7]|uniref:thiolase family protein n=1 Tax=Peribacillus sp. RS7 TaxID=3242679 RepID=UPI0035C26D91
MSDRVVIVDGVRTAIGRFGGSLKDVNSGFLASHVIEKILEKTNIPANKIDEVILGEVRQSTESSNVARVAAIRAGVPLESPAFTVNRLCASGIQAIASGVQQIKSQQAEIIIAGGTESMSQTPIYLRGTRFGGDQAFLVDSNKEAGHQPKELYGDNMGMGITAENVALKFDISREDQDEYALESQRRALEAINTGKFKDEIVPYEIKTKKGSYVFETDEHPRPETTLEKLQSLKPAFKPDGTVTAGNSCGRNDGSAAVLLMTEINALKHGLKPKAAIVDWTSVGVPPEIMGIGPIPSIRKLLDRTKLSIQDIDLFELNEAFASQALAVQRELSIDRSKLNVNGGAIALGHPIGASGARIVITLMHELKRRGGRYGVASLCAGGGQGMAILIENLE